MKPDDWLGEWDLFSPPGPGYPLSAWNFLDPLKLSPIPLEQTLTYAVDTLLIIGTTGRHLIQGLIMLQKMNQPYEGLGYIKPRESKLSNYDQLSIVFA